MVEPDARAVEAVEAVQSAAGAEEVAAEGHHAMAGAVHEAVAEVKMCQLTPPSESPLYSNSGYTIILKTFDRFGNPMSHGGLPVSTRLQLIKSGVHDLTTLMPNNNTVDVEDQNDGTYHMKVRHRQHRSFA